MTGNPSQALLSNSRPVFAFPRRTPTSSYAPHCLKKNATFASWHCLRMLRAQSGFMGRARCPLSPPTITQLIPVKVELQRTEQRLTGKNRTAAGTRRRWSIRDVQRWFSTDTPTQRFSGNGKVGAISASRSGRFVNSWNWCQDARSIVSNTCRTKLVRHVLVEQVAHAVHEDQLRLLPQQGSLNACRPELQVEALLVRMPRHATKSLGKRLGVAISTARRDLCAARYRVPRGFRPLDVTIEAHSTYVRILLEYRNGYNSPHGNA